jgi:hypothetical protein
MVSVYVFVSTVVVVSVLSALCGLCEADRMDTEKLIQLGQGLGLSGEKLLEFIEKRESTELEKEERLERDNLAREERAHEREQKALLAECQRRDKELDIVLMEREIELEKVRQPIPNTSESTYVSDGGVRAKTPRLPPFDEKDNLDAYLQRFERFAVTVNWKRDDWATNLSALLKGKALDVYSRLAPSQANDYDLLKDALLKRFQLTEDGFRQKFRSGKPETGETASQFVVRLDNYLDRWMALGNVSQTFDALKDLLLREQFLLSCGKGLLLFLKERAPKDIGLMAILAEQYNLAHGEFETVKTPKINTSSASSSSYRFDKARPSTENFGERKCYGCGSSRHQVRDCPNKSPRESKDRGRSNSYASFASTDGDAGKSKPDNKPGQSDARSPERRNPPRSSKYNRNSNYGKSWSKGKVSDEKQVAGCCMAKGDNHLKDCCVSENTVQLQCGHNLPVMSAACKKELGRPYDGMPVTDGYVGSEKVSVLRDSGCSGVVVKKNLVKQSDMTGKIQHCVLIDGTVRKVPVARVSVDTPYFVGVTDALCMENPVYDLILGNITGVRNPGDPDSSWAKTGLADTNSDLADVGLVQAVETRAQKVRDKEATRPLKVSPLIGEIGIDEIKAAQQIDPSLLHARNMASTGEKKVTGKYNTNWYLMYKGLLYREFQSPKIEHGKIFRQLVVPEQYRILVLRLAHESIMAGHLGTKKTTDKILTQFYWPGLQNEVQRFCRSCDVCQKTVPRGKVSRIPLGEMPLIDVPFKRVAVDLVGPIQPVTDMGRRYILTLVDYATRYPEAVALKRIDTETVAEALVDMYARVGVPEEILTDMGTQFTSDLMKEVGRLLSIKQLTTTPYHPQCNGLVERFNGTLKRMLRRMCSERPKDWDRYISALLFAYRESPQESTGFSPFQLIYGRTVRGPMAILRELWTREVDTPEVRTTYQYVLDLKDRLQETCKLAREELQKSQKRYKVYYDRKSKDRQMSVGDKVLLLLPTDHNKLLMQWQGPHEIVGKVGLTDYRIEMKGKVKTYHANLLKKYIVREQQVVGCQQKEPPGVIAQVCSAVIDCDGDAWQHPETYQPGAVDDNLLIEAPPVVSGETLSDVLVNDQLSEDQLREVSELLREFSDVLTDSPGTTNLVEHGIEVTTSEPVRSRPYPIPHAMRDVIKKELDSMLEMGVIEPSESAYSSPVVLVKKPDGSNRFCIDYRKLNRISKFDAEPMPNPDELFTKLSGCKYLTKIDLSKGYWQIVVKPECRHLTAFVTSEGLFQFRKMPFGFVTAGATFSRMMRKLLKGMEDILNFLDDILVYTNTWKEHLRALRELFTRLRNACLTARPTKCMIGYGSLDFMGHTVGDGKLQPREEKLKSIVDAPRPETKKQVRSFLGLVGYFRKFIPNFSAIAAPLTDQTKKGKPSKIEWNAEQELSFNSLKQTLTRQPILKLPDLKSIFILRTDASDIGIGAVLLQEHDGTKFPIAYASKKLLPRERAYSVIERECLALVWGVRKFETYLYGVEFVLETDHYPLIYLNKAKLDNGRIMRWALFLQSFRFRIVAIKGIDNVGADFLSRHSLE